MNRLLLQSLVSFLVLPGTMAFALPLLVIEPGWRELPFDPPALIPLTLGSLLLLWCTYEFHARGRGTLAPWSPPEHLVTSGPYRFSRNPMYVALMLILVGWATAFHSWRLCVYAALMLLALHLRILLGEEPRLAGVFGQAWADYRRRAPRWIGIVSDAGESSRTPLLLTGVLAAVMATQSILGLVFASQYRDIDWIKATWYGNDWMTLVVATPLVAAGARLTRDGSLRGLLIWLGLLGYAAYNYAFYLVGAALNAFFPLYVAGVILAIVTLITALPRIDAGRVARFAPGAPVRILGSYLIVVGAGLASVWLTMWAGYVFADRPTPVAPEAFKIVAALDLSIMVPALIAGGAMLLRQDRWGYVVAAIASLQATLYLIVLSVNSVVAIRRGLAEWPGELPLWGALAIFTGVVPALLLASLGAERRQSGVY